MTGLPRSRTPVGLYGLFNNSEEGESGSTECELESLKAGVDRPKNESRGLYRGVAVPGLWRDLAGNWYAGKTIEGGAFLLSRSVMGAIGVLPTSSPV